MHKVTSAEKNNQILEVVLKEDEASRGVLLN